MGNMKNTLKPEEPMIRLQNQWFNALCDTSGVGIERGSFQISQPAPPISKTDKALWRYLEPLPPESLTYNHCGCANLRFFDEYLAFAVEMVLPQIPFEQDIGKVVYKEWEAYIKTLKPTPLPNELPGKFREWAMLHHPGVMNTGASALSRMALTGDIKKALAPYEGKNAEQPGYTETYKGLLEYLRESGAVTFRFDSAKTSPDVRDTWALGNEDGISGLWTGLCANTRISRRLSSSRVTVRADVASFTVLPATPGSWYNSSLMNLARTQKETPPWQKNANPSWTQFFGPDGSMRRYITSIFVADGLTADITCEAAFCKADQQTILKNKSKGLWPFFISNTDGVVRNDVRFDAAGLMTVSTVTQPDNPFVLGNNVFTI